jgi:hypothetical protein
VAGGDRVIAGVEDEKRDLDVTRQESDQAAELGDGGAYGVEEGCDAEHIERGRPRVMGPLQLADPLIVPAGHDGLSGRMLRGRVAKAPLGAALRVATVPGRYIDGKDERPAFWSVLDEQAAELVLVDAVTLQRLVEAAVRAAKHRLKAEGRHRRHRKGRTQYRIGQLEEHIAPGTQTALEVRSELPQLADSGLASCHAR